METSKKSVELKPRGPRTLYRKPGAIILTTAIIIVGGLLALSLLPNGERVNGNGYQVVYMTSGQVYFGKLKNTTGEYLVLDVPYTAQDVQPQAEGEQTSAAPNTTTLLKVSQQQYGPEDTMSLKSDQVLFWQNLRDNSKVTQAIKNTK